MTIVFQGNVSSFRCEGKARDMDSHMARHFRVFIGSDENATYQILGEARFPLAQCFSNHAV